MTQVRIGIIGTGVGLRTLLPGFNAVPDACVVALSGSSMERTRFLASQYSIPVACENYDELCSRDDIDLVCVTSPNPFHFEHTQAALENAKHVLCEKPFTIEKSQMEQLIAKREEVGVLGLVDHQLRFNPYIVEIRKFLRSGLIGKPYFVQIHQQSTAFSDSNMKWSWSFDANRGGGVRYAMCSHFADLLNFWFNANYYNLSAHLNPVYTKRPDTNGTMHSVSASTFCGVSLELEENISIALSVTAGACSHSRFDIRIYGERGEITFDLNNKLSLYIAEENGPKKIIDLPNVYADEKANQVSIFSGSFRYFAPKIIHAIKENNHTLLAEASKFEDARYTFDFLDAISKAANGSLLINPMKNRVYST
jgi:Predicted dehydrogenases and related proteins